MRRLGRHPGNRMEIKENMIETGIVLAVNKNN
jgi:hypothetical protein